MQQCAAFTSATLTVLVLLCMMQHIIRHVCLPTSSVLLLQLLLTLLAASLIILAIAFILLPFLITLTILPVLLSLLLLLVDVSCDCLLQGYDRVWVYVSKLGRQVLRKLLRQQQQQMALQLLCHCNRHTAVHSWRNFSVLQAAATPLCDWCC
jgi:hypothetical protein